MENVPRYAIYSGRRVRILEYRPDLLFPFKILDKGDTVRYVGRAVLRFLPEKKKG
jgi:hypothetical protein